MGRAFSNPYELIQDFEKARPIFLLGSKAWRAAQKVKAKL